MTARAVRLGPSLLAADFLRLGEEIAAAAAAGADFLHVDVMDGHFVPNLAIGLPMMAAIRRATALPLDVHLMVDEPWRWVEPFADAGADVVTVHVEADPHLHRTLRLIEEAGAAPGVTLNPASPLVLLEDVLPIVRQVLVMGVNPGFGGQTFIPSTLDRLRRLRAMLDARNPTGSLAIDGGVKASNIGRIAAAGADWIVAGTALFAPDRPVAAAMAELRAAIESVSRRVGESASPPGDQEASP